VDDAEHMPFYVLFGVIVAALLAGISIAQYNRQLEARVDEQAQALANDLARVSFTAFSREQPSFPLPPNLGGSDYELSVDENNSTFIVHIKAGRQSGMSYYSTVSVSLSVESSDFAPGGKVYFQRMGEEVVVSSSPIAVQGENLPPPATATPPEFYGFAKENAKAATAITATYFFALENYPQADATVYRFEGDNVLVQISYDGENLFGVRVSGYENRDNVGKVDNSWIVASLTISDNLTSPITSPSVENARASGWLYSPAEVLAYLRSRTWRRVSDNLLVVVPADASVQAAAATTNVSTYLTYRVTFEGYVLHYRAMPWWAQENTPGFVFQSEPELEAIM
jgi:hypothetical protein